MAWFRLARQFKEPNIRKLKKSISSKDFVRWQIFNSFDPDYPERGDIQTAQICTLMANVNSTKKKFKLKDFLQRYKLPTVSSRETIKTKMLMWKSALTSGGKKKRTKKKK